MRIWFIPPVRSVLEMPVPRVGSWKDYVIQNANRQRRFLQSSSHHTMRWTP